MKLPQYRLLKISSSRKGTSIVAEWVDFVTCGECKHWVSDGGAIMFCEHTDVPTDANDFCSYGEREGE